MGIRDWRVTKILKVFFEVFEVFVVRFYSLAKQLLLPDQARMNRLCVCRIVEER